MPELTLIIKQTLALIAIVDPLIALPLYLSFKANKKLDETKIAKTVAFTVFVALTSAIFFGEQLLVFFGVSLESFKICGGLLLLILAIDMMQGRDQKSLEDNIGSQSHMIAYVPLSIPLLAGPGAIGNMIIAASLTTSFASKVLLVIPVLIVSIIIWSLFNFADVVSRVIGDIGAKIITRLMGLILGSLAIEIIVKGIMATIQSY